MTDLLTELVKTWTQFTLPQNATKKLAALLNNDPGLITQYLELVDEIPYLSWEAMVTTPDLNDGWDVALPFLNQPEVKKTFTIFPSCSFVQETEKQYPGQCHLASYELWKSMPGSEFYTGFCAMESCAADEWQWHSFVVLNGDIYESSGFVREKYSGYRIDHPEKLFQFDQFPPLEAKT